MVFIFWFMCSVAETKVKVVWVCKITKLSVTLWVYLQGLSYRLCVKVSSSTKEYSIWFLPDKTFLKDKYINPGNGSWGSWKKKIRKIHFLNIKVKFLLIDNLWHERLNLHSPCFSKFLFYKSGYVFHQSFINCSNLIFALLYILF